MRSGQLIFGAALLVVVSCTRKRGIAGKKDVWPGKAVLRAAHEGAPQTPQKKDEKTRSTGAVIYNKQVYPRPR